MQATTAIPQAIEAAAFLSARGIFDPDTAQIAAANDALIAAQAVVETGARRLIGARTVVFATQVRGARFWFPVCPIVSITSVSWSQDGQSFETLDPTGWWVEDRVDEPSLTVGDLDAGVRLRITAQAGGEAPRQMFAAIRLLAAEWFDAGLSIDPFNAPQLSFGVRALISQVRYGRPMEWADQ